MKLTREWFGNDIFLQVVSDSINNAAQTLSQHDPQLNREQLAIATKILVNHIRPDARAKELKSKEILRKKSFVAAISLSEALHTLAKKNRASLTFQDAKSNEHHADEYLIEALQFLQEYEHKTLEETLLTMELLLTIGSDPTIGKSTEDRFPSDTSVCSEYSKLFTKVAQKIYSFDNEIQDPNKQLLLTKMLIRMGEFFGNNPTSLNESKLSDSKNQFIEFVRNRTSPSVNSDSIMLLDGSTRVIDLGIAPLTLRKIVVGKDSVLVLKNARNIAGAAIEVVSGGMLVIDGPDIHSEDSTDLKNKDHINAKGASITVVNGHLQTTAYTDLTDASIRLLDKGKLIGNSFCFEGVSIEIDPTSEMHTQKLKQPKGADSEYRVAKLRVQKQDEPNRAFRVRDPIEYFPGEYENSPAEPMVVLHQGPAQKIFGDPHPVITSVIDPKLFGSPLADSEGLLVETANMLAA